MLSLLLTLVAVTLGPLAAFAADPEVSITRIANLPSRLFYFDDTPVSQALCFPSPKADLQVVMMQDPVTLKVLRSPDEGKTWTEVSGPEEAIRLVPHPHNTEMAFIIGKSTTHWVTYNRGDSWQSFTTPREASLSGETLSFHAEKEGWILFQGLACDEGGGGIWGSRKTCWDETYYTTDAFRSESKLLLKQTSSCLFARSTKDFSDAPENTVFCVAFDENQKPGMHSFKESRLYSSDDWFENKRFVDLGIGKKAKGVVGLGVVSKFLVVAMKQEDGDARRAAGGDAM